MSYEKTVLEKRTILRNYTLWWKNKVVAGKKKSDNINAVKICAADIPFLIFVPLYSEVYAMRVN